MSKKQNKSAIINSSQILKATNRINAVSKGLMETGDDNWLLVKKTSSGANISIPKYCRVKDISFSGSGVNKRENFTIIDWPYANEICSVVALPDSTSRFGDVSYNVGAVVEFDYRTKTLTVNPGGITVKAGFDISNQLGNGEYLLSLPDSPHSAGHNYLDRTKFALSWFFINDSDALNRYFHTGMVSLGCLTVGVNGTDADIRRWTDIASLLSKQRMTSNNAYVGKLVVKGL
jgi:hypothetical protein